MSSTFFDEPTPGDADLDDDNLPDDETPEPDDADDDGADETTSGPSGKGSAPARGAMTRPAIRRIAAKAQEITETEERIVAVAASVLGVGTGLAEMTTAIMAAPRSVTQPVNDLNMIATSDPMEAAINAGALGRDRIKGVWTLLSALSGSTTAIPAANAKAAIAVAKAVFALDDIAKAEIEAVSSLLKKN